MLKLSKNTKIYVSISIFLIGLMGNVILSSNIHYMLSNKTTSLKRIDIDIIECFKSVVTVKSNLLLFLSFQVFIIILIVAIVSNNKPYQSDLVEITPMIKTPVSAGQNQFGSARWLQKQEFDTAFKSFTLKSDDKIIKLLVDSAEEDE